MKLLTLYQCPECGADLLQPGAIIVWQSLPRRSVAHIEPGDGDSVIVILDGGDSLLDIYLQCSECGADIIDYQIEDINVNPEFEEAEEEED